TVSALLGLAAGHSRSPTLHDGSRVTARSVRATALVAVPLGTTAAMVLVGTLLLLALHRMSIVDFGWTTPDVAAAQLVPLPDRREPPGESYYRDLLHRVGSVG